MNKQKLTELLDKELNETKDTSLGDFVSLLVNRCQNQENVPVGIALAASFDLLVGIFYYQKVPNRGWLLCTCGTEQYFFPFVNVCPHCAIEHQSFYHKAGKGQSANIGSATIKALILFIREGFNATDSRLKVLKGEEPVDLCVFDEANRTVLLAEVKSAPLLTLPLVITPDNPDDDSQTHETLTIGSLKGVTLGLLMPYRKNEKWHTSTWNFNRPFDNEDNFFVEMLTLLINQDDFFNIYLETWQSAFDAYSAKNKAEAIFWLTNGCGVPSPVPNNWPDRAGSGRETISNGKTSVGLDRTDDIKQGVYQLLKLRLGAINQNYIVKVGIVSNAHAARHHSEYIEPIENILWLQSNLENITMAGELLTETPIHNLFDGIITFTKTYTRDSWVKQHFGFDERKTT